MSNSSKETVYKEYKLEGPRRFKRKYEEKHEEVTDTVINTFLKYSGISSDEYAEFEKTYLESVKKVKPKCTEKRVEGFRKATGSNGFVAFYDWYVSQGQACGYCGISQDELYELFSKGKNKKLPLNNAVKRSSGTLEIERRDSENNEYSPKNCILACPLCNNAKSNLIDEDNWVLLFVEPMREYYKKLLGKDLENPNPKD